MSDYTPSIEEIESAWVEYNTEIPDDGAYLPMSVQQAEAQFRRAIAAHDAEKRAEWEAEQGGHVVPCARCGQRKVVASDAINSDMEVCGRCGTEIGLHELAEHAETEWEYGFYDSHGEPARVIIGFPAPYVSAAMAKHAGDKSVWGQAVIVRRRKASDWLPVPDTGVES